MCDPTQRSAGPYLRYMLFEPGSIGQPEFALLLVCVRGFRARNPDGVDGQARGHIVCPIAGGLADQVHELAFRPDRIANAHQTLVAKRVDRIEDEIFDSRGFLDHGQEMLRMLPRGSAPRSLY